MITSPLKIDILVFTIDVLEADKTGKISHILDNMGILVSSQCGCMFHDGEKECQYGPNQACEKGYVIIVPRKHREVTISVANAVDATG